MSSMMVDAFKIIDIEQNDCKIGGCILGAKICYGMHNLFNPKPIVSVGQDIYCREFSKFIRFYYSSNGSQGFPRGTCNGNNWLFLGNQFAAHPPFGSGAPPLHQGHWWPDNAFRGESDRRKVPIRLLQ